MAKGARARSRAETAARTPLEANRDALQALELERGRLLAARDELVAGARAGGASWGDIARQAGTTRQALLKRRDTP